MCRLNSCIGKFSPEVRNIHKKCQQDISFLNDLMAEVSGIFPNMVGAVETTSSKTATEINTKTQGQMTRLSRIVDTINQDLIIPNVEKVAKLCADFKSGVETIFVNHENQQEVIEVDDFTRQCETALINLSEYSSSLLITAKSPATRFSKRMAFALK